MTRKIRRPTQRDVAREAGVSRAVVSYVINKRTGGNVRISEATRRRVLEAVERLGYQPNITAQSLRTQRTQLLAIMVPDLTNPFYPLLIRGAQAVAEEQGYDLLVYDTNDQAAREQAFVAAMLRRGVDGVILVPFRLQPSNVALLAKAGIEAVTVCSEGQQYGVDRVVPAERPAVHEVLRHLLSRGHRRIAHLAGAQDTPPGQLRMQGYVEGLAAAGIPYDPSLVRYGTFRRGDIAESIKSLFEDAGANAPTALFAANDLMAIDAIRALDMLGRRVPDDVAVCGFDNIPEADAIVPPLTTVDQGAEVIGHRAAELLLERVGGEHTGLPRRASTPCHFIRRSSA